MHSTLKKYSEKKANLRFLIAISEADVEFHDITQHANCVYPHVSPVIGITDHEYLVYLMGNNAELQTMFHKS